MDLHVESRLGPQGELEPKLFELGGTMLEVIRIIDRWISSDYSYFKIEAADAGIYILRYTSDDKHWELTLFQARAGLDLSDGYGLSRLGKSRLAN